MYNIESNYNLIDWWKKVYLKNYATFRGRARRAEYWYYLLTNFLIYFLCIFAFIGFEDLGFEDVTFGFFGIVVGLFWVSTIIPTLAAISRRLHDTNKSGTYIFMYFIPIAGPIILLVALFTDGDRFPNNYGPDPKNPGLPQFDFENYKES
jgi:uncharacterized membrane protein YhaH (DUF805 family)